MVAAGTQQAPYIDMIDVIKDHAPLRPWIFPSPTKSSTTDAELQPETHQSQHPAPHPQSQAIVRASADPSLSNIPPALLTLKYVRNFDTMAMRT